MATLAHKAIIFAASDGVVIQPLTAKGQTPTAPVKVRYRDGAVVPASWDVSPDASRPDSSFETFGIVGLFTVSQLSFLISITRRSLVASIAGSSVYVVTEVAVTPCSSRSDADAAITRTAACLRSSTGPNASENDRLSVSESEDEEVLQVPTPDDVDEVDDAALADTSEQVASSRAGGAMTTTTIAQDVIGRRGTYGRFARRWFGRRDGLLLNKRMASLSVPLQPALGPSTHVEGLGAAEGPPTATLLLPRLLRTTQILFGSASFFFSYDYDLTRSLGRQHRSPTLPVEPLCRQVDVNFFWNRHLLVPFISTGQTALALPLMQGFVGQREFIANTSPPQRDTAERGTGESVEMSNLLDISTAPARRLTSDPDLRLTERRFLITLISRRSTQRAGLRYLRRGIDEQGHVANAVETEQLLSPVDWNPACRVHSFAQIRGSIPLFFTQTPYSFKPVPILQHSPETNLAACRHHFDELRRLYRGVHVVNLVEKRGNEAIVGDAYRQIIHRLNDGSPEARSGAIAWEWFDFHAVCRGMKFERVSLLLDILRPTLDDFGSTILAGGVVEQTQDGVLRTNCMDCLDRTNVCQSSFAKHMLDAQLRAEGIDAGAQLDQQTIWFNELWADNGDAVSKQYASTAAMKGDYTRTRKRNYRGTLNDLGLSLSRFYSG